MLKPERAAIISVAWIRERGNKINERTRAKRGDNDVA